MVFIFIFIFLPSPTNGLRTLFRKETPSSETSREKLVETWLNKPGKSKYPQFYWGR